MKSPIARSAAVFITDPLLLDCAVRCGGEPMALCRADAGAWGVGAYEDGEPVLAKRPLPLEGGPPSFRRLGLSRQLQMAAVNTRRPFSGVDCPPFVFRRWMLIPGGRLGPANKEAASLAIPQYISRSLKGGTAAEQMLHQFLGFLHASRDLGSGRYPANALRSALRSTLSLEDHWFPTEADRDLSLILGDGRILIGATLNRPMWYRKIDGLESCLACGGDIDGAPISHPQLRGTLLADGGEPPAGDWRSIEQNSILYMPDPATIEVESLEF